MTTRKILAVLLLLAILILPLLPEGGIAGFPSLESGPSDAVSADGTAANKEASAPITLEEATETAKNYGLRVFFALLVVIAIVQIIKGSVFVLERLSERSAHRRLW